MIIHKPSVNIREECVCLSAQVTIESAGHAFPETLWFSYPQKFAPYVLPRADAFFAGLLQTAMALGEDLQVEGPLSPRLLYAVEDYQALFHTWRPKVFTRTIRVIADDLSELSPDHCEGKAMTAFSGGLDAFAILYSLLEDEKTFGKPVFDYGLYIQGTARQRWDDKVRFLPLMEHYTSIFDSIGKELIQAETNIYEFFPPGLDLLMWLSSPLISTAFGLGVLSSTFYIGTGISYQNLVPDGASPLVNDLLRTERMEVYTHGMSFSRLDKLQHLKDWNMLQENMLVCFDDQRADLFQNCGVCPKCLRTRAVLEVLGMTGQFKTFPPNFTFRDTLRWGRWLEIGHGWEWELLALARTQRRRMLPVLWLGIFIGYTRHILKALIPGFLKRWLFRFTSPSYFNADAGLQ